MPHSEKEAPIGQELDLLEQVYDCITGHIDLASVHIPHSDVFFAREALQAKFPDREFSIEEVEQLLEQEYGWNKNHGKPLATAGKKYVHPRTSKDTDEGQWPHCGQQAQEDTQTPD